MLGDFANVQQAIGARKDFDEGAKISQANDFAQIGFPDFRGGGQVADHLQRPIGGGLVGGGHVHLTGIVDIDFYARSVNNAANHLAARPDEVADLIHGNLHGVNARSISGDFAARGADGFVHFLQDVKPSAMCLCQCFAHDGRANVGDFDIHLQRGNAVAGASNFEVNVDVMILGTGNIGED